MTCTRIKDGFICTPSASVSLAPFGSRVWCEMHSYLGPTFYRGENSTKQIRVPSKKTWLAFEAWQKSLKEKFGESEMTTKPRKNYGRHDLMAVAAIRYCLGRMTYIVSDCADWIIEQWPNISDGAQKTIQRDVDDAFVSDDEERSRGKEYKTLGHDCDRAQWERVRKLWRME